MPYVEKSSRERYDAAIAALVSLLRRAPAGEVNYCVTRLATAWLDSLGPVSYTNLNAVIGILESAKLELYRRCVAPYETGKAAQNGDVYNLFPQEEEMK